MACNVFGKPITDSTLERMSEYGGKKKTNEGRAYVALERKNVGEKGKKALEYVEKVKAQSGSSKVSTAGLIYNATGNAITLVSRHDWHGCVGPSPFPYRIENGQWGAFLHVDYDSNNGSEGAVVYRCLDMKGEAFDLMLSWSNPPNRQSSNKKEKSMKLVLISHGAHNTGCLRSPLGQTRGEVNFTQLLAPKFSQSTFECCVDKAFTEIHRVGHYADKPVWGIIRKLLDNSSLYSAAEWDTCLSTMTIGNGSTVIFEAIFTLRTPQSLPYPIK